MNKIKNIIFVLIVILLSSNLGFTQEEYQGDLSFDNATGNEIQVRVFARSIPFDGFTFQNNTNEQFNRWDTLQNGPFCRYFTGQTTFTNYQIYYYYYILNGFTDLHLALLGGNPPGNINMAYGHGIYEINIFVPSTNKMYKAYFNCLDSKYGNTIGGLTYGRDFTFTYKGGNEHVIVSDGATTWPDLTIYPYEENAPITEIKVWEVCGYNEPYEKRFYARTTPFGVTPKVIEDNYTRSPAFETRDFFIGTKVVLDHVYDNYDDNHDRWGYNTVESNTYGYFYNTPKVIGFTEPDKGHTYTTPGWKYINNTPPHEPEYIHGCKLIARVGDELVLKNNKRLWITGDIHGFGSVENVGDTLVLNDSSIITMETDAQLNACYSGRIMDYGAIYNWSPESFTHIFNRSSISYFNNNHLINNGAHIEIDGNAKLTLADNSTVTFDGEGTYLKLNQNSIVKLGNNAKIEFKNGAKLIANGSTFSAAQNSIWKGLYFENSGMDSIQNCTFSGAEYPIDIKCENQSSALVLKTIKQNIFNLTGSGKSAIKTNNAINLLIDDNTINMPSDLSNTPAVYLRNALTFSINGGGNSEDVTSIRVINNEINNGSNSIIIANYVSSFLPVFVDNNVCYNSSSSPFIGRYITGTISNNNFDNQGKTYGKGAVIHQGNPELFRNRIYSKDAGLTLLSSAVVNMSPSGYGSNQLLWIGGENNISSTVSHTLNFNSTSYANIDFGHNNFYKTDAASTHLYGSLSIQGTDYYVRENCWYNTNIPIINLLNSQGTPVNVIWQGGNYTCNIGISQLDSVMLDWGAGVYQYIPVSNKGQMQYIAQDELLYGQSVQQASASNYPTAINLLKQLINEYQSSQYLSTSLYDLFTYYEELDTSQSAGERDILYGNLKTYLNERILSGLYDYQFESDAFYIIVMCEANMMNTQLAVDDFQFLSLYHPQPEVRLLASWDYTELEALNGQGGSIKEFKSEEEMIKYVEKIAKRIGKKYESDPLRSRLMKTYRKINDEYTSKEETLKSELSRAGNEKNEKIMTQKAELDTRKEMNKTASMNIISLRSMPEKHKEERRFNDLMIISGIKNIESKKSVNNNNITPEKYELGQNYPNPFNPVTNIQFQVPSLKFVKLVVYDMLGREVKTLVNEIKSPGIYIVSFDASSLSSGVYFYKMTAGEFTNVKRMVLVK